MSWYDGYKPAYSSKGSDSMAKYRCPKFGSNGIGLPAGTRKVFRAGKRVVGDTPGYLAGGSNSNAFLTTFGYRGHRVLACECRKCGRTKSVNNTSYK